MPARNGVSWLALMACYTKFGVLAEAENPSDEMPERNIDCWNSIISACIDNNRFDKALLYFDAMPVKNFISWAVVIGGYIQEGLVAEARQLFDQAPEKPNSLYNALLSGYVEFWYNKEAWELFEEISEPDVTSWITMISCFSRSGETERARALFEVTPEQCAEAYTAVIGGYMQLGDVKNAQNLFDEIPIRDVVAWNSMINGYVKKGMSKEGLALFWQMPRQDTRTWNSILQDMLTKVIWRMRLFVSTKVHRKMRRLGTSSGYQSEEAPHLLSRMSREGFIPDQGSFTVVTSNCGFLASLGWGRAIHAHSVKCGCDQDFRVASSLIAMYTKCGLAQEATKIFDRMPKRDTIAWNAMLYRHKLIENLLQRLTIFLYALQSLCCQPDHFTFLTMLSTCVHNGLLDQSDLFASMQSEGKLVPRSEHYTCVIDLLGRSG